MEESRIQPPMAVVPLEYNKHAGFRLPLLKRPRPLPQFDNDRENGMYAEWKAKGFVYRDNGTVPRVAVKVTAFVQYDTLIVQGKYPKFTVKIPLIKIGFVESSGMDFVDIRGRTFRLFLVGLEDVLGVRDSLRYLVVRQRVPHSIMGRKFDWQEAPVAEKQKKVRKVSKWSPLNCFLVF